MVMGNYKGCSIFVEDSKGNPIAKTVVLSQDQTHMTLTVEGNIELPKFNEAVTVLILRPDGVHAYQGNAHRSPGNPTVTDIDIYKGHIKEDRKSKRFGVNVNAYIPNLVFNHYTVPLLKPMSVTVVNLSTIGALIRARTNSFIENSGIELSLNIGGRDTNIYGKIVRVRDVDEENTEYGCKFIEAK